VEEFTSGPDRINKDGYDIELLGIDYWQLALALVIVDVVGVATKGRF